ncbi:hypothetical protein AVEN_122702-1 [Araneus ventricosus]|uniref:Uncharacterized protein n=1 Tax=Araneus ventricosus TaxID=182803 RepID=A0A4Y2SRK6_ARAVE|nr:hypothetical protein AVEN_122702-1 [Araneus ventricosus]
MAHVLSAEEDRETADRVPEFSVAKISMAEKCGCKRECVLSCAMNEVMSSSQWPMKSFHLMQWVSMTNQIMPSVVYDAIGCNCQSDRTTCWDLKTMCAGM